MDVKALPLLTSDVHAPGHIYLRCRIESPQENTPASYTSRCIRVLVVLMINYHADMKQC
jgi:hypothetical protein